MEWPATPRELVVEQQRLAQAEPAPWSAPPRWSAGGCFVCFGRGVPGPGRAGDRGWGGAALVGAGRPIASVAVEGRAGATYTAGLLALREGPLLEAAVRALPESPDVLLVNATGRDHPRRAGLALHLGAILDVPSVGVTHRPLLGSGDWPELRRGATSPLRAGGEPVGYWVCTRNGVRPLVVHPGWRTDAEVAVESVLATVRRTRTPEPLRRARQAARAARTAAGTS